MFSISNKKLNNSFEKINNFYIRNHPFYSENNPEFIKHFSISRNNSTLIIIGEIYQFNQKEITNYELFANEFYTSITSNVRLLNTLNGLFIIIYIEGDKLYFLGDRYRSYPVYYSIENKTFIVSSTSFDFRKYFNLKLDVKSCYEYMRTGTVLPPDTIFSNIFQLKSNSILIYENGNFNLQYIRNEKYDIESNLDTTGFEQLLSKKIERLLFKSNFNRTSFALTGGIDSRVTLSILIKMGVHRDVNFFTHGLSNSNDIQISRRIAKKYKLKHNYILFDSMMNEGGILNNYNKMHQWSPGTNDVFNSHLPFSYQNQLQYHDLIFDSTGSEIFRDYLIMKNFSLDIQSILNHLFPNRNLKNIIVKDEIEYFRLIRNKYLDVLGDCLNRCETIEQSMSMFYAENKLSTNNSFTYQNSHFLARMHFLDNELFKYGISIENKYKKNNNIHYSIIKKNASELLFIPFDYAGEFSLLFPSKIIKYGFIGLQRVLHKLNPRYFQKKYLTNYYPFYEYSINKVLENNEKLHTIGFMFDGSKNNHDLSDVIKYYHILQQL